MNPKSWLMNCTLAVVAAGFLVAGVVIAQNPGYAGPDVSKKSEERIDREKDKGEVARDPLKDGKSGEQKSEARKDQKSEVRERGSAAGQRSQFEDQHRLIVRDYYEDNFRHGNCPRGLAKKPDGCMAPG